MKLKTIIIMAVLLLISAQTVLAVNYTSDDVALHNSASDCWLIVNGKVYDVTSFIPSHPGGSAIIPYCGADGSAAFGSIHQPGTVNLLPTYYIGDLGNTPTPDVNSTNITAVMVSPPAAAIFTGESQILEAVPVDVFGNQVTGEVVTWSSTDESIATVSADGMVTGISQGSAIIKASAIGFEGNVIVSVIDKQLYTIDEVNSHNSRTDCWLLVAGRVYDVTKIVPVHPGGDVLVPLCGQDASYAFYGTTHKPTAGFFLLTAFLKGELDPTPYLDTITIEPSVSMFLGTDHSIFVDLRDQYGSLFIPDSETWSSSDESVVSVNGAGKLTALSVGSSIITYTATTNGIDTVKTVEVEVKLDTPTATSIKVSPVNSNIGIGSSKTLTAKIYDQYGNLMSGSVQWISQDESVATVDSTGIVTSISTGTVVIQAKSGDAIGVATVIVSGPFLNSLDVSPFAITLFIGKTQQATGTPLDQDGNTISADITWSSTDESVATVDNSGLVTSVGAGTAYIVGIATSGDITVEKTALVIVSDKEYTAQEVAAHAVASDCWMRINGNVYDATNFVPIHPGGNALIPYCGQEATDIFKTIHSSGQRLVNLFFIGIEKVSQPTGDEDEHEDEYENEDDSDNGYEHEEDSEDINYEDREDKEDSKDSEKENKEEENKSEDKEETKSENEVESEQKQESEQEQESENTQELVVKDEDKKDFEKKSEESKKKSSRKAKLAVEEN